MLETLPSDPLVLGLALLSGLVPALVWLWFWLKEDDENPEPIGLLTLTFIVGMISVVVVIPLQQIAQSFIYNQDTLVVVWAFLEEFIKYAVVALIALKTSKADEPIDFVIYMVTGALGFAAFENALFLLEPIYFKDAIVSLITGNLRFLGATLLHAVSSGIVGIALGLSFYKNWEHKRGHVIFGLLGATLLHSVFNFLIMGDGGENSLRVFAFLWIISVIISMMFERLRRLSYWHKQTSYEQT
jgi:RsiW-degrading membrane proteinase PrsW (M82 family)